jgi:ssRNA-specific RNase YbeY (16S rRNA maturation enzyme)
VAALALAARLGEVVVCADAARRQAPRYRRVVDLELCEYVVHGILHLCGYDDRAPRAAARMRARQRKLLDSFWDNTVRRRPESPAAKQRARRARGSRRDGGRSAMRP